MFKILYYHGSDPVHHGVLGEGVHGEDGDQMT